MLTSTSVEVSIYVHNAHPRKGIASSLYDALIGYLDDLPNGPHRIYAGITLPNEASFALHQKMGFSAVGRFDEVGFKFDRYWDVLWLQRRVNLSG